MKTVAYLKTSKDRQDIREQRQTIVEFAQRDYRQSLHNIKRVDTRLVDWFAPSGL